ncbi:uncharacterized protein LOC113350750 [Papaver somniferum]|uniref:uncharacterized protein LOC113350750 n=1 Tax=Papaver somniferum TaxID=3469 RepID=UPI000E6FE920|nr:uncharacterized protein LOC113350750 [Papaver somniferum]
MDELQRNNNLQMKHLKLLAAGQQEEVKCFFLSATICSPRKLLVELIANLFPPTPKPEGADEDEEGISDGSPMEGTDDVKEGTDGLTLDDTDEDKEGTDGFTRDDAGEDKEGFADGLLPEDTDEVIEGTTYGLTLANESITCSLPI